MATYAIGDVQGCDDALGRLLDRIGPDPASDRLWFVGDLVNRGPGSAAVLRRIRSLGAAATAVLGNHDLHLLACAAGVREPRPRDTLADVLSAPDREELLAWLGARPLLVRDRDPALGDHVLVHAGLLPGWSVEVAEALAREAEAALAGPERRETLATYYGPAARRWSEDLQGPGRVAVVLTAMTRLRTIDEEGRMDHDYAGPLEEVPSGRMPWFDAPGRASRDATVVCGHWAALGLRSRPDLLAVDTGCVWGRSLTAVRLDDRQVTAVPADRDGP